MATRGSDYPVCIVAIKDGANPGATVTNDCAGHGKETSQSSYSTKSGALQDFSSHIGSSGIIVNHEKGLVLTTLLPFTDFLHNGLGPRTGDQSGDADAEDFRNILSSLSVSVILPSPKDDKYSHFQPRSKWNELEPDNGQRDKTLIHQTSALSLNPWMRRWKDKGNAEVEASGDEMVVFGAKVAVVCQCHALEVELQRLLPKEDSWTVDYVEKSDELGSRAQHRGCGNHHGASDEGEEDDKEDGRTGRDGANYVSWFVLLQVDQKLPVSKAFRFLSTAQLHAGQPVIACGTPFATLSPSVFLNSLSSGIITKISGLGSSLHQDSAAAGSLVMTDARCIPGMEGGGLFVEAQGQSCLAAIIISPLCWKSNELVGLTLACSISAILESLSHKDSIQVISGSPPLLDDFIKKNSSTFAAASIDDGHDGYEVTGAGDPWRRVKDVSDVSKSKCALRCLRSVVLLKVGTVWGSGVIVDVTQGLILTCRHVVKNAWLRRVSVKVPSQPWTKAEVVYMTPELSPLDLAVLRMTDLQTLSSAIRHVPMSKHPHEGSKVYAVGYPLFEPSKSTEPAVTSGIVSKVVQLEGRPVMIQSSCAVHAGASGGGLICAETGRLLAIIASNSKDVESSASFPHVNFSIPVVCFQKALDDFVKTGDASSFQPLETSNQRLAHIWALKERGRYRFMQKSKL